MGNEKVVRDHAMRNSKTVSMNPLRKGHDKGTTVVGSGDGKEEDCRYVELVRQLTAVGEEYILNTKLQRKFMNYYTNQDDLSGKEGDDILDGPQN
ncbi:hypothetical protein Cadr_000021630 [Camelus dromedarius]|uniref:Uncharacterized protein n=1 Tax=Camelus dromedarius TaxID=9838 RepID=A0A5N4CRW0_CAMDR|nr:hypothetical protein Cadr_000021630 [Camelus dromedarius]